MRYKICSICGNKFVPTHNKQAYCSDKCKTISIRNSKRSYRLNIIDEYASEKDIHMNEKRWKSKPKTKDINSMLRLLKDFGIDPGITPDFKSYSELNRWKNKLLSTYMR